MGNTFTSWSGLVLALQQEVAEATAEVIDASMDDLFMNIDQFYSSSEGRYTRTGTLRCLLRVNFLAVVLYLPGRSG